MWRRTGGRLVRGDAPAAAPSRRRKRKPKHAAITVVFSTTDLLGCVLAMLKPKDTLGRCARVARQWQLASISPLAWSHVDTYYFRGCSRQLRYLTFVGRIGASLSYLRVYLSQAELPVLWWLLRRCETSHLKRVSLRVTFFGFPLTYTSLAHTRVDLTDGASSGEPRFVELACNYLKTISARELEDMPRSELLMLVSQCPMLESLDTIRQGNSDNENKEQHLEDVEALAALPRLHTFRTNSRHFPALLSRAPQIKELRFAGKPVHGRNELSIASSGLRVLDFSDARKGWAIVRLDLPRLERAVMGGYHYAGGLFLTVSQQTIETLLPGAQPFSRDRRPSGNVLVYKYRLPSGNLYEALARAAAGSGLKLQQLCSGFATVSAGGIIELDRTQIQVPSSCDICYCDDRH